MHPETSVPGTGRVVVNAPVGGHVDASSVPVTATDLNNVPLPVTVTVSGLQQPGLVTAPALGGSMQAPSAFVFDGPVRNLSLTALDAGPVTVCFEVPGVQQGEKLFVLENGAWTDRTVAVDVASSQVCAQVQSISASGSLFAAADRVTATVNDGAIPKPASGAADLLFTITVNASAPETLTYNTRDITAVAGTDYDATSGTLTFAPGITTQTIAVPIIAGRPNSLNLSFSVFLTSTDGATFAIGAGTILPPVQISYTLAASPASLALIASSIKSSDITLHSDNGISETAQLSAAWNGTAPTGVTFELSASNVSIPPGPLDSASATVTVTTPATPSPGTFTLTLTATSATGVTRVVDLPIVVAASLPAPTCGCTKTGPFESPGVKGLVPPDPLSGDGPGHLAKATVTVDRSNQLTVLTLTRNDGTDIPVDADKVSAFGFSPNGKLFVLIAQPFTDIYSLTLYSVSAGGRVGTNPLVMDARSWGFSPDDDNRFLLVTSSANVNASVEVEIYDTQTGTRVMQEPITNYASFGAPAWTKEENIDVKDKDTSNTKLVGGLGFSPDGNSFELSYSTGATAYFLGLWNLTHNTNSPLIGDWPRRDVKSSFQFSPCSDLFMLVTQAGANPATSDNALFFFTSNGKLDEQVSLATQGSQSATVVTKADGSKEIQLTGMGPASIPSPQCSMSVTAHSPVNIVLLDKTGQRTGFDPGTNGVVNQIPGGSYTGVGSEPQTVAVPYVAGAYLTGAFGLDTLTSPQPYTLTIATRDASGDVFDQTDVSAIASRGSEQEFAFTVGDGPIAPRPVNSPPTANAGSNQTLEATSSAGAAVTLTGAGSDPDAGDTVSFTWMEGTATLGTSAVVTVTLAIGGHDLTLTVTDNHGASATSIAHVTVQDTTPPVLALPENQILEATGPSGAVAVFTAAATDIVDGSMSSTCAPPAGSTFPLGVTIVRCAAADAHGNSASGVFTVTVSDTNPPVVTAPPPIAVPVTEATGARAANWPALASFSRVPPRSTPSTPLRPGWRRRQPETVWIPIPCSRWARRRLYSGSATRRAMWGQRRRRSPSRMECACCTIRCSPKRAAAGIRSSFGCATPRAAICRRAPSCYTRSA